MTEQGYRITKGDKWYGPTIRIQAETIDFTGTTVECELRDEANGSIRHTFAITPDITTVANEASFTLTIEGSDTEKFFVGMLTGPIKFQTASFGPITVLVLRLEVVPLAIDG